MGLKSLFGKLFGGGDNPYRRDPYAPSADAAGKDVNELARRLAISVEQLKAVPVAYSHFTIPKRTGRQRKLAAPCDPLKEVQRAILRRLLTRLPVHPAAKGFQPGESIVTNALPHAGQAVVFRMDLKEFFPSTTAKRVLGYFRRIGWDREAGKFLTKLCTHDGGLPQGAPTSPRLSNLVNVTMDARLAGLAASMGAAYTRYADDLAFSLPAPDRDKQNGLIGSTKAIVRDVGYRLHQDKKFRISRRHHRQLVTGLVVNDQPNLPRQIRRRLRAVQHHLATGRPASMTPEQLAGWLALQQMVLAQSGRTVRETPGG
ncbi:MAG: reverse transcriptase family protein [Planctomycetota bacterium]